MVGGDPALPGRAALGVCFRRLMTSVVSQLGGFPASWAHCQTGWWMFK